MAIFKSYARVSNYTTSLSRDDASNSQTTHSIIQYRYDELPTQRGASAALRSADGAKSAANRCWADSLNALYVVSPVLSYLSENYEGFLPIPQIQPLPYSSNISTSE